MKSKILEAKQVIQDVLKKSEHPLIVNFSGGKDSCALLLLALEVTKDVECIYMKSGIDLPGSVDFVEEQCKQFNVPLHLTDPVRDYQGDFDFWVKKFGYFPAISYTWCSSRLKMRPARAYLRKIYGLDALYKLTGVRRAESSRRKRIYKGKGFIEKDYEHSGSFMVHPLLNWTDQDVLDYLKEKNFTINKNYKPFGVSGCYYCPFYQVSIYQKIMEVYPNIYDHIINLENEIEKPSVNGNRYLRDIKKEVNR